MPPACPSTGMRCSASPLWPTFVPPVVSDRRYAHDNRQVCGAHLTTNPRPNTPTVRMMKPGQAMNLVTALATGERSAAETVDTAISRIEVQDTAINAVVVRDFDRAREQAARCDERIRRGDRAPLLGLPMTVKESFNVAGLPTTWGLPEHAGYVADRDAEVVARLKSAGAIILGKTNVAPMLADLQSTNPVYGATHNPYRQGM